MALGCIAGVAVTQAAADSGRLPPQLSHEEVVQLFERERYDQAFPSALNRYEWGDEALHYELGAMYYRGLGTPVNHRLARQHLELAAQQGRIEAMAALAQMIRIGEAGPSDRPLACQWYEKAADQGHLEALYQWGRCLQQGHGQTRSEEQALQRFHQAGVRLHPGALHALRFHYERHGAEPSQAHPEYARSEQYVVDGKPRRARRAALTAIQHGDYRAYSSLADTLQAQGDAPDDVIEHMYALGELFGSPLSSYSLGRQLDAARKPQAACQRYVEAFFKGLAYAGYKVGKCYQNNHLPTQDARYDACRYFNRTQRQGEPFASVAWAGCLLEKASSSQDIITAIEIYATAVNQDGRAAEQSIARQLCAGLRQREILKGTTVTFHNGARATLTDSETICVIAGEQAVLRVFSPGQGWVASVDASHLKFDLAIEGFALAGLNREQVRATVTDNPELIAASLTAEKDVLHLASQPGTELIIKYREDGAASSLTRMFDGVTEPERFFARIGELISAIGHPAQSNSQELYHAANWDIQGWSVLLMQDLTQQLIQERYVLTLDSYSADQL